MRIGIEDSAFFSLQQRLLDEGHELYVLIPGFDRKPAEGFNVTASKNGHNLHQVCSFEEMYKQDCAFILTDGESTCYEKSKQLGVPTIGHSKEATILEFDRFFAKEIHKKYGLSEYIKIPEYHQFDNRTDVVNFLKETKKDFVLKQSGESPSEIYTNRTVVSRGDHSQTIKLVEAEKNAWFHENGAGGIVLEEFVVGQEVCFGSWFDGEEFNMPFYWGVEHKGAQNENRGFVLTGEIGTTLYVDDFNEKSTIVKAFRSLEPYLEGKCNGMIDINCMLDKDGMLHLIEYTVRFGRPTLEMQLSMLKESTNFGEALHELAQGEIYKWEQAFHQKQHGIGVSVMSYGHPFDTGLPSVEFEMPKVNGKTVKIQQLFASCREGKWHTTPNERQFTVAAHSLVAELAIEKAYEPLKYFNLLGCTWRDDVGEKQDSTHEKLIKHNII